MMKGTKTMMSKMRKIKNKVMMRVISKAMKRNNKGWLMTMTWTTILTNIGSSRRAQILKLTLRIKT